jgi:aspartate aminotransferase
MKNEYIRLRDQILAGLTAIPGIKCSRPEGAFYVYPNISALLGRGGVNTPAEFAKRLLHEAHLATVPGEGFGTHEHVRISYATKQSELDRGLERLRSFVSSL